MDTNKWGKHGWIFLHYITFNYPMNPSQSDIDNYYTFFDSLKNVLPCDLCNENYKNHLHKYSLLNALKSRTLLIKWLIDVHNATNKQLGKNVLSYDKAMKKIEKFDNYNLYYFIIVLLIIIIIKIKY